MPIGLPILAAFLALVAFFARLSIRRLRQRRALQAQHPGEPWMWRQDWADRAIRDEAVVKPGFLWVFGLLWIAISLPVLFAFRVTADRDRTTMIFLSLFPIVGVGVFMAAAYQSLRRRKYGVSLCRLQRLPVAIGSTFRGEVQARVHDLPEHGFQVELACVRRVVHRSGKSRSVRETILWQDEQTVGSGAAMPSPDGMRVPVHFAIPRDCEPTDDSNPSDSVLWRLIVRAGVPGIDYAARFTLPVFRTADAPEADNWPARATTGWTPPPNVVFSMSRSGGEDVVVKPAVPLGDWFGYLFFIALWYSALVLVYRMGAPLWIVVLFAVFGTIVLIAAADLLVGRSAISADPQTLTARRSWLGLGRRRTFAANEVESIVTRVGTTTGARARYNIEARFRDGKARVIAKHLVNRRDADGVAARVWRALGH